MDCMNRKEAISTIRFLSYSLHAFTTVVKQNVPQPHDAAEKENRELSLCLHLITMLDTGFPRWNAPAVTGKLTPEGIKATIVISSNSNERVTLKTAYLTTEVKPSKMTLESLRKPSA